MSRFKKLFEPIGIGNLNLKNRVVMSAVALNLAPNGKVTDTLKAFYKERAAGGAGLILLSFASTYYDRENLDPGLVPLISDDSQISVIQELTGIIHKAGAKVGAQLIGFNNWAKKINAPVELVGPSRMVIGKGPAAKEVHALTVEEIQLFTEQMGESARRAKEAGFDAIEFHALAGETVASRFLSPFSNKRTDEYGGSIENRCRFLIELIRCARKKTGKDYPIICRLSGSDFIDGGNGLDDCKVIASILEREGVAALDISTGWFESVTPFVQMGVPSGSFIYLAHEVKKTIGIPVIGGTKAGEPELAERALGEGKVDLIYMARPLIADPDLPNKAKEGRSEEIRPCISCCHCLDMILSNKPLSCSVNPYAGQESMYRPKTVEKPKKVFIVGGGPAGVKSAAVLSEMGHRVELWEKEKNIGGQVIVAATPPYKAELQGYVRYLNTRLRKSKAKIHTGTEASADILIKGKPDVVVLASGATPLVPEIKGVDGGNVVHAVDVLNGKKITGDKVVIIGGGMIGCETAEFLSKAGKKVTILEMLKRLGGDIGIVSRWVVLGRLKQAGIVQEASAKVIEIIAQGVKAEKEGKEVFYAADTVVLAAGMKSFNPLYLKLKEANIEIYSAGDCVKPARILDATSEALRIAYHI